MQDWKVDKDEWNTGEESEVAKACDHCITGATFIVSDDILGVVNGLCEKIKEEWQLLLLGEDDGETVVIADYYVPKQEYSAATVTNLDCIDKEFVEQNSVVATIHSHASMGVFFSNVDYEKTNKSLIKNHIVVNNKGEMCATKRVDLPCGMKKFVTAKVVRDLPKILTPKKIKGFHNIQKKAPVKYSYGGGGYYQGGVYHIGAGGGLIGENAIPGKRKIHAFDMT